MSVNSDIAYEAVDTRYENIEDTQKNKYLTFAVGKEEYGIDISYVTEIIGIQSITEVPELPEYMMGIINLRGKIIPVMDIRKRFKKEFIDYNDRTCIIVIDTSEVFVGLIVDTVSEVLNIPEEDVVQPPDNKTWFHSRYVKNIGKVGSSVKLILDCERLLQDNDIDILQSIVQ